MLRYNKHDCQCDLASVYKNLGSKTQSSAIDFTTGDFYRYCSRPVRGSPSNPLEQPRPGVGLEGRRHHQGKTYLGENQGGILNIQTLHGSNTIMEASEPVQAATTTFISDSSVVRAAENHDKGPTLSIAKKSQVTNVEDIKRFLAKPVTILSSSFSNTDTVSTFAPIAAFQSICSQPLIADKLRGFLGIRATIVYTIVVNGNRFQQGRYMFAWVPVGGASIGTTRDTQWYNAHISTLKQRSQLHRVEVDINCDTEAELVVPFSSAINWYPLAKTDTVGLGETGYFCIFPYVAIAASGGSTTAYFKVYAHLEDVELFGAAVPQMGKRASARIVKKTASEMEAKNSAIGPVESVMGTLTSVSNALTVVPMLAPFATPASWVFEALTGVAASFGWSKPPNLAPAHRIVRQHAPYMGCVDNDDYALPLSLEVKNSVEAIPGLGFTDADELDFLSFITIPTFIQSTPWPTASPNGTLLMTQSVDPLALTTITSGITHHTPLSFVASFFDHWRGGMVFKLKLVKTEFHSGRLCVTFSPSNSVGDIATTSYTDTPYLERKIYDIRECNEIIVSVPYTSVLPYLDTKIGGSVKTSATGLFQVWVEDQLVAPANVTNSITILMEAYGAEDMEFAHPAVISQVPVYGLTPQMGERSVRNDCRLDNSELSLQHATDQIEAASKCMGERIRSFRSLLKAYSSMPNTPSNADSANETLYVFPFFVPGYRYDPTTPVSPICVSDLYGTLHGVFTYARGGVRWAFQVRDTTTEPTVPSNSTDHMVIRRRAQTTVNDIWVPSNSAGSGLDIYATNGLKVFADTSAGNLAQVSVPAYSQSFTRLCAEHIAFKSTASFPINTNTVSVLASADQLILGNTNASSVNSKTWVKFRAGADDCDFSHFISIMPMIRITAT